MGRDQESRHRPILRACGHRSAASPDARRALPSRLDINTVDCIIAVRKICLLRRCLRRILQVAGVRKNERAALIL